MFSSAEKTTSPATAVQQKAAGTRFFRKAGEEGFFGNKESASFFHPVIQPKLSVSHPDDPQEKEADEIADQVMRMPEPEEEKKQEEEVQLKAETQISRCAQCGEDKKQPAVQLKAFRGSTYRDGKAFNNGTVNRSENGTTDIVHNNSPPHTAIHEQHGRAPPAGQPFEQALTSSKGSGSALPASTQRSMENRFGADFSGVRIHDGSQAQQMSKEVNAEAFTHGNDIYFNSGKYAPGTDQGDRLLAHELTHTIQQGASPPKENRQGTQPEKEKQPPVTENLPPLPQGANAENPLPGQSSVPATPNNANESGAAAPQSASGQAGGNGPGQLPPEAGPAGAKDQKPEAEKSTSESPAAPTAQEGATEEEGGPEKEGEPEVKDEKGEEQKGKQPASFMEQIEGARNSEIKTQALSQAALVNEDYLSTVAVLNQTAQNRKNGIRQFFAGVREGIEGFFVGNIVRFQLSVMHLQLSIVANITSAITSVQAFITRISTSVISHITSAIQAVTTLVTTALTRISENVSGIASQITGYINNISLPDLPGVETLRGIIVDVINTVSSLVTTAMDTVQNFIGLVLGLALQAITELILTITQILNNALSVILSTLTSIITIVFSILMRIMSIVTEALLRLLRGSIWPMLARMENTLLAGVDKMHRKALKAAEKNRMDALQSLAYLAGDNAAATVTETRGPPMTTEEMLLEIEQIGAKAKEQNAVIVATFTLNTSAIVQLFFAQLSASIMQIITEVISQTVHIISLITQAVTDAVQLVWSFLQTIYSLIEQLVQQIITEIARVVQTISDLITNPVDTLVSFAQNALNRITTFVRNLVSNFISGVLNLNFSNLSGSAALSQMGLVAPAFVPAFAPAPVIVIIVKVIIVIGGLILIFVEGGVIIIVGGVAIFLTTAEFIILAIVVLIIAIVLVILVLALLYALYLLVRWIIKEITKPRPRPRPKCKPGEKFDPTAPSGTTSADPIEIIWFKPLSAYPDPISIGGDDYFMTQKKELPPPLDFIIIGVDGANLPFIGKPMLLFHTYNRGQEGKFKRRLNAAGYSWRATRTSPDHVQDLMWNGPDEFENLWPLDSGINSRAGRKQNLDQEIYFRPDPLRPCAVLMPIGRARFRYHLETRRFIITSFKMP